MIIAGIDDETRKYLHALFAKVPDPSVVKEFDSVIDIMDKSLSDGIQELQSTLDDLDYWKSVANMSLWRQRLDHACNRGPTNFMKSFTFVMNALMGKADVYDKLVVNENEEKIDMLTAKISDIETFLGSIYNAAGYLKQVYNVHYRRHVTEAALESSRLDILASDDGKSL